MKRSCPACDDAYIMKAGSSPLYHLRVTPNMHLAAHLLEHLRHEPCLARALLGIGALHPGKPSPNGMVATLDTIAGRSTGDVAVSHALNLIQTMKRYPSSRFGQALVLSGIVRAPVPARIATNEQYWVWDPYHDESIDTFLLVDLIQTPPGS